MLSLSRDFEHALAAMALLARYHDASSWDADEIGQGCHIPPLNLDVILSKLAREGLVTRLAGIPPRYALGRRAADISITDIIEAVEPPTDVGARGAQSAVECSEGMVVQMLCCLTLSDLVHAELQEIVGNTQSPPSIIEQLN